MIKYCKTCFNPSARPSIKFDKNGKCYLCAFEPIKKLDFNFKKYGWKKKQELKKDLLHINCKDLRNKNYLINRGWDEK